MSNVFQHLNHHNNPTIQVLFLILILKVRTLDCLFYKTVNQWNPDCNPRSGSTVPSLNFYPTLTFCNYIPRHVWKDGVGVGGRVCDFSGLSFNVIWFLRMDTNVQSLTFSARGRPCAQTFLRVTFSPSMSIWSSNEHRAEKYVLELCNRAICWITWWADQGDKQAMSWEPDA